MIRQCGRSFALCTPHTAYAFRVLETGHLEHLYYGPSLGWTEDTTDGEVVADCAAMAQRREFGAGNTVAYDPNHTWLSLEALPQEASAMGKGDVRAPLVVLRHKDGSATSDFLFEAAKIRAGKTFLEGLPGSYGAEDQVDTLILTLRDRHYGVKLELQYCVYRDCDAICRASRIINDSDSPVTLERLLSTQLDFHDEDWLMTVFHGAWAREMEKETVPVGHAAVTASSIAGVSSNRMNPFVMLHRPETTEETGLCYGMNLIYSGNHLESAAVGSCGGTRFLSGVNPEHFSFLLAPGEAFQAPEAVMVCSRAGFSGMSRAMHRFVRDHVIRGTWKFKPRPVLLNSWEAAYFDVNEAKVLRLARAAASVGAELMVLDDGWFGDRKDDFRALGDWDVNPKKFPGGLRSLSKKVRDLGLDFGIWIEPEMVNSDSNLYRAHPEWAMEIPGKPHSEGRNQRILDLCNPAVTDYLLEKLTGLLSSARISYVKWDMNRIFSDVYSQYLPPERQGETAHRYVLGLYRLLGTLTRRFPEILFEGCASGGNRFDLGILCYCPQIWASDNTDALSRAVIQEGYSYGYPMNAVTAHVSACPNHQTLRETPLSTRFGVAAFGVLGYEMNLADSSRQELETIRQQITLYKQWRDVLQFGDFYRLEQGGNHKWICVSRDRKRAVGLYLQTLARPNHPGGVFRAAGLDPARRYRFYSLPGAVDLREFGDLLNTVAPVHIKQDSLAHNVLAKFMPLSLETEDMTVSGTVLMESGVQLAPAYGGTGFNDKTRHFPDFASRLYFMEAVD